MIIAIVVANVWGVIQVIALGSLARTIRVRTVFAAMAVGLYVCAPLATLLQVAWPRLAAPLLGVAVFQLAGTASYTLDPFVEELLKILPLAVLLTIPVLRRQSSLTDYVLIGAATGAGFGLAENLYRFSTAAGGAQAVASGWAVAVNRTYFLVPNVSETLTSWLPIGASWLGGPRVNAHLVWSAIGGLAVGLTVLNRTTAARLAAVGLFLCIGLDHAATNAPNIASTWLAFLATPLAALPRSRGVMPIAALVVAWWLDPHRQRPSDSKEPLLAAERSASSRVMGTLGAAVSRVPWSALSVDRFVRMRRAYNAERASAPAEADGRYATIVSERDRVDRELAQLQGNAPPLLPAGWTLSAAGVALRQPAVIIWLVLMAPSVLWFVVGGWPQTARLQAIMMGPVVWKAVFPISVLAQVLIAWRVIVGLRAWPRARALSIGDDAAVAGLRLACGIGAVGLGAFSLMRLLGGLSPGSSLLANLHAKDAANRMTPAGGLNLANGAGALAPPPPTSAVPASAPASAPQALPDSAAAAGGGLSGTGGRNDLKPGKHDDPGKGINVTNDSDLDPSTLHRMGFKHERDIGNTQIWVNASGEEIWRLPPSGPHPGPVEGSTEKIAPADQIPPDIQEIQHYEGEFESQKDELYRRSVDLRAKKDVLPPADYARLQKQWTDDYDEYADSGSETENKVIPTQTGQLTQQQQGWKDREVEKLREILHTTPGDFFPPNP